MKARLAIPSDRTVIAEWRRAHELAPLPDGVLPECGVVIDSDEGQPMATAFLQMDDSTGVGMLPWTITNPVNSPRDTYLAVAMLFQAVREVALSLDYGVLLAAVGDEAMRRMHISSGFVETDREMTHLRLRLDRADRPSPSIEVRRVDVQGKDRGTYNTAMSWWAGHGWPGVNLAMLPRRGLLALSPEGAPRAFGWLYKDNSVPVCMLEWVVTNPANTPKQSLSAIVSLIDAAKADAAAEGCTEILTSVRQPALERAYARAGFSVTQRGVTHLVMITGLENPAAAATMTMSQPPIET